MKRHKPITTNWTPESILNKQGSEVPKLHVFSDETDVFWLVVETPGVYFMTRISEQLFDAFRKGARARRTLASLKNEMIVDHLGWAVHRKCGKLPPTTILDILKTESDQASGPEPTDSDGEGQAADSSRPDQPESVPVHVINPNPCWRWRNRFGTPPADPTPY